MTLFKMENRRNFGFSAENPTGTKGGGTRGKDCEKLNPCIQIQPGETVTLCDTDGPGMVTHMPTRTMDLPRHEKHGKRCLYVR